jgi:hypothetical protein
VIELLKGLGLTSEAGPWQVQLVARPQGGWAWLVFSTEYELDGGIRGGLAVTVNAESGQVLRYCLWEEPQSRAR